MMNAPPSDERQEIRSESYLSLFAGVGGLEHPTVEPLLVCDSDQLCRQVLAHKYPRSVIWSDIRTLATPPPADFVVGGWPCQDLSSAGATAGIRGAKSGLFFEFVRVAQRAGAHTLVGENVPNMLRLNRGDDFAVVIATLRDAGYEQVSWRTLKAREFGLPQERRRVVLVASKHNDRSQALLGAHLGFAGASDSLKGDAFGFYWTGGTRSICYSRGYVPALKVGASGAKGRSAVAVFAGGVPRKLSASECLRVQGLDPTHFEGVPRTDVVRMAGNAVPVPLGHFAVEAAFSAKTDSGTRARAQLVAEGRPFPESGFIEDGRCWSYPCTPGPMASNLADFLEGDGDVLSAQACAGLLVRSIRSGQKLDAELFEALLERSHDRSGPLRGARSNSFEILDKMDVEAYRRTLSSSQDRTHSGQLEFALAKELA